MSCLVISAFAPPPPIGGVISPGSSGGTSGVTTNGVLSLAYAPIVLWHGVSATVQPTLTAAKTAAVAGDLIDVRFGVYNENNLLKNGVNWKFSPGTYIWYYATSNTVTSYLGLFDDRSSGACTSSIYGDLNFFYSTGTNSYIFDIGATNSMGAWVITNANSSTRFDFDTGDGECYFTAVSDFVPAILHVGNGRTNWTKHKQLLCTHITNTVPLVNEGGFTNLFPNYMSGVIWQSGDFYMNSSYLAPFPPITYALWSDGDSTGNTNGANGYFTIDLCTGFVYHSALNANYKSWFTFKEYRSNSNGASGFNAIGGKVYLTAEKLYTPVGVNLQINGNTEVWATIQKISNEWGTGWLQAGAGSTIYAHVEQYEDVHAGTGNHFDLSGGNMFVYGGIANGGGSGFGIKVSNAASYGEFHNLIMTNMTTNIWVTAGTLKVDGGYHKTTGTGGKGIVYSAGDIEVRNTTFDTTSVNNTANNPVFVDVNGLRLKGVTLFAPALATAINASTAKTVDVYWSASNVQTNANITFGVNAGYTVNSGVK